MHYIITIYCNPRVRVYLNLLYINLGLKSYSIYIL